MKCKGCDKEFTPVKNNGRRGGIKGPRLFCSPECRNRYHQRTYRKKYPKENQARQLVDYSKHKEERIKKANQYRDNIPDSKLRSKAMTVVLQAVRSGKIKKPEVCPICKVKPKRIEAHHFNGYDNPLDILWVCTSCHKKMHIKKA